MAARAFLASSAATIVLVDAAGAEAGRFARLGESSFFEGDKDRMPDSSRRFSTIAFTSLTSCSDIGTIEGERRSILRLRTAMLALNCCVTKGYISSTIVHHPPFRPRSLFLADTQYETILALIYAWTHTALDVLETFCHNGVRTQSQ